MQLSLHSRACEMQLSKPTPTAYAPQQEKLLLDKSAHRNEKAYMQEWRWSAAKNKYK